MRILSVPLAWKRQHTPPRLKAVKAMEAPEASEDLKTMESGLMCFLVFCLLRAIFVRAVGVGIWESFSFLSCRSSRADRNFGDKAGVESSALYYILSL